MKHVFAGLSCGDIVRCRKGSVSNQGAERSGC
jgi:hypothetical protein